MLIATLLGAAVLVFAGWLNVRNSEARLYVFAAAFGVGVSGIASMLSVVVGQYDTLLVPRRIQVCLHS